MCIRCRTKHKEYEKPLSQKSPIFCTPQAKPAPNKGARYQGVVEKCPDSEKRIT